MTKAPKFREFISEAKDNKKYRILVISGDPKPAKQKLFRTARRIVEECEKAGHKYYVVEIEGTRIEYEDGIYKIYNKGDEKGFEIHRENTIAIVRGSVRLKLSWMDLLSRLEKTGICMVNSREVVEISSDKYRTYVKLQDFGLTQPKTVLIPNADNWKPALEELDTKFPIIMKTLEGSKGVGVLFVESERQIESLIQLLYSQNESVDLLIQEYIKTDGDIRVLVLGGKIIASMKRSVVEGDFRSNVSQGAAVKEYPLTELEVEQCLLASKALNGTWTAVDFIPSKNPKKDPPYILEVNHSPGTEGIEEATKRNIVKEVIDYFSDSKNRYSVATQCGYLETVSIKPWGDMVAKFDTGNSVYSVIHGEDIKISGNKVSFTLMGKRKTYPLEKTYNVKVGSIRRHNEERPVIKLDVEFAGSLYREELFGIDDRTEMGTEVLLTRRIMSDMNVLVNPARKYVVTTKYSLE